MIVSTRSSWLPQSLPLGVQEKSFSSASSPPSGLESSVAGAEDFRRARFDSVGSVEAEGSLASLVDLRLRPGPALATGFAAFFRGRPPIFL